ncbi:la-related protein 7 [Octopus bimaculoides]|uniref:La-related protein 7 n=1 Tax=Octopus bimaculoides TaxID=37653 RepID=A0A0L8G8E0_OCTBM|nr:la-related protein 7 [Octopus bimaculoides]|eukprot:XP_014783177.1 PREDICTED: la-related protein 7-like [Octopus bimaculoides]
MESVKSQEKKPAKKRVKALCVKIKEQMEFYFSNSNLHKDRFFKKQIDKDKDGYIDLSLFLTFNRIKSLTEDLAVMRKALSTSSMLQLSENQNSVRRVTPYTEPKDVDERTVYVELLPANADHDWLKKVFSSCGMVTYVSLPRYKSTGDLKQFAFVEFETIKGAQRACKELNQPPIETTNKPGKFPKNNKALNQLKKKVQTEDGMDLSEEKPECDLISNDSPKNKGCKQKRKRNSSSEAKEPSRPIKQRKLEPLCGENTDETNIKFEGQAEEGAKSEDEDRGSGSWKKKKKKKRHWLESFSKLSNDVFPEKCKLQRRSSSNSKLSDIEPADRLAQKSETDLKSSNKQESGETATQEKTPHETESRLENLSADEGIDSAAKDTKRSKRKRKKDSMDSTTGSDLENVPKRIKYDRTEEALNNNMQLDHSKDCNKKRRNKNRKRSKPLPHLRVISKKEWLKYKSEYLARQRSNMSRMKQMLIEMNKNQDCKIPENSSEDKYKFIPNVIVNIKSETVLNVKELKGKLTPLGDIAYIDLKEVDTQAFVRCKNEASAQKICNTKFETLSVSLLEGEDEKCYWDKLKADRESKINSKHRLKKRGTLKLLDKMEKINTQNTKIYFDD